jgi:ankyrin repeat protein
MMTRQFKLPSPAFQSVSDELQRRIDAGEDLCEQDETGWSVARNASRLGLFDAIRRLLESGADISHLQWTPLMHAAVFAELEEAESLAVIHGGLELRDRYDRTPFLLAVQAGRIDMATHLLELGSDRAARGRCGRSAIHYAAEMNDLEMVDWLLQIRFSVDEVDEFDGTALRQAIRGGEEKTIHHLIACGASLGKAPDRDSYPIYAAESVEVVELLLGYGQQIDDANDRVYAKWLGVGCNEVPDASPTEYAAAKARRFGQHNAEETSLPFWLAMIRAGASAWCARKAFDDDGFKEPIWCFERFGRTTIKLADGRIVLVGGEHEDFYDPDFCIYNDVIVFEPDGGLRIFSYPEDVFPPTDNHSATRVGDYVYLIGNLGYQPARKPGFTPVYRLDLRDYRIELVATQGDMPGWISRHRARLVDNAIVIEGGEVFIAIDEGFDLVDNTASWRLDLSTGQWSCLADVGAQAPQAQA